MTTQPASDGDPPRARHTLAGAAVGVLTAAVAIGTAQLAAGLTVPQSSPVLAVGQTAIDLTPAPVKNFAISEFGSHDKTVLLGGILVLLALYAARIGVLSVRRLSTGLWGLGLFALIGLLAAFERPGFTPEYVVPTLAGAVAGAFTLTRLARAAARLSPPAARPSAPAVRPSAPATRPSAPAARPPSPDDARRPAVRAAPPVAPEDLSPPDLPPAPGHPVPPPSVPPPAPSDGPDRPDFTFLPNPDDPRPSREPERRRFLVASGVAAAVAAAGVLAGRELMTQRDVTRARAAVRFPRPAVPAPPLPAGSNLNIPGLSSFITPNGSFYRVDTALILPQVDPANWRLRIHGMVRRPVTITFDQLLRRPLIEDYVTLTCVSDPVGGPYVGNAKWLGASLADLIRQAGPHAGADQLLCTSVDGFTSGTPLAVVLDGRDALLAVAMNGTALPVAHGFPARMVVPGLYGYVSATKWVTDIEVTTFGSAVAYWASRGWSQQAPIKTESRIDVPAIGASLRPGLTPVAGVAWAQHKGIAAVQVRVDHGPWQEARLAAVPDIDTWRQWVWEWPATPGHHLLEARATDHSGYTQTPVQAQPEPNGASGYPSASVTVSGS